MNERNCERIRIWVKTKTENSTCVGSQKSEGCECQAKKRKYIGPKIEAHKDKANASGGEAESACVCVCLCVTLRLHYHCQQSKYILLFASSYHQVASLKCLYNMNIHKKNLCSLLACSYFCVPKFYFHLNCICICRAFI
jgi:hypothetical protein